ncbi:acyl-CoA thioesterase [Desulfofustis glycolicus]|jgi:acyl-CoA thioester hydrolase|uniref:Acyl-CoA thioester hydrolase n=1 Tax=Desulfofustis glycolicus DSM 9705 TaxID=1121409 RepID=A0A1M5WQA7_9BACT|nr:thioesterase family protein [Desulfofustis glycolicus]SHH89671.1 acyl-CoA thioester hydrolase [Desulfofustis glycolicus DSM 9705]
MTTDNQAVHRMTCRVLYGDTDAGGVVYNANYLRYFEQGRTEMMRERVCSYRDIEKLGIVLPVTECFVRYKSPAFYDDLLIIETTIAELHTYTCKFTYRILRQDEGRTRPTLLTRGYTINAAITRAGKLTKLPDHITTALHRLLGKETPPPPTKELD